MTGSLLEAPQYRPLTRKRRTVWGRSQLWLGPDHLLLVKSTYFQEQYHRFALRDVQAVLIQELGRAQPLLIWGLSGLALLGGTLAVWFSSGLNRWLLAAVCLLAPLPLLYELLRGPRCLCRIVTAVSDERIAAVSRLKTADRLMTRLVPLLEEQQGRLDPALLPRVAAAPVLPRPMETLDRTYLPEAFYGILLGTGLMEAAAYFSHKPEWLILPITLYLPAVVLLIVVLIRQRASQATLPIRVLNGVSAICLAGECILVLSAVIFWVQGIAEASRTRRVVPTLADWPTYTLMVLYCVVWRLLVALPALLLLLQRRRAERTPAATPGSTSVLGLS